jgi:predicted nucleic acid-binding protein
MFDADIVIWFLRGEEKAAARIARETDRIDVDRHVYGTGAGCPLPGRGRGIRRTLQQAGIRMLPLTASIGGGAAALMAAHAGSSGLQIPYALIASTAREHDRVLVTGNVKHFRGIAGLEIEAFRR